MTKAAVAGELPSLNSLPFGGGRGSSAVMKRKTPTELRGEMLKRQNSVDHTDESLVPVMSSKSAGGGALLETKKLETFKAPRYVDTQLPYSVTKNSTRNRLLLLKGKSKAVSNENLHVPEIPCAENHVQNSSHDNVIASESSKDNLNQVNNKSYKECSNVAFPSLTNLFSAGDNLNGSSVDMDKAFKDVFSRPPESGDRVDFDTPQIPCTEFTLPGHKIPLDLSIKTNMRVQSSSSVNWFHRLINRGTINDIARYQEKTLNCAAASTSSSQTQPWNFHSWVHPQSTLPRSAISALTLAGGHTDFLLKRQQAWEDSFRSLYYVFRKNICRMFYVCTEQFVVMFTGAGGPKESKRDCFYAYISRSTTHLRSLLKEHDISFAMPLCQSKVEEVTAEDLVELSEIAKYNLGQTRATATMTGVDNTPQSSLMITGNNNVHGLYEFLLNYRVFLSTLTGDDVPVLYSPVVFENAALSAPEVSCKEVRRVGYISNKKTEVLQSSSSDISYSIEISDAVLPPWIISDICNAMRSNGGDFEVSFKTKSISIGLNIGLGIAKGQPVQKVAVGVEQQENGFSFGIPNTAVTSHLHSTYLDGLKYSGGSYTASLSRVTRV